MKVDGMTLWQRMVYLGTDRMDWDGNSTEYGLAWCEVVAEDAWFGIHEDLKGLVSLEPGEPAPYAIVTENGVGQVEVLTFDAFSDFRRAFRERRRLYDKWLDSRE